MSKQQGTDTPEVVERNKTKSKKRHGKYELWMRTRPDAPWNNVLKVSWHKIRSYQTKELAEKNKNDSERKWNALGPYWEFEVRVKDDVK
jgi:hypothetical protein